MAEYFDEFIDIRGKYIRKPIEQTTKVTKIKVRANILSELNRSKKYVTLNMFRLIYGLVKIIHLV